MGAGVGAGVGLQPSLKEPEPPPCPASCGPGRALKNPCYSYECISDARSLISFCWVVANLLVLAFLACALAVAAQNDCSEAYCSRSLGFAAVWTLFMCLGVMVGGTKVMR